LVYFSNDLKNIFDNNSRHENISIAICLTEMRIKQLNGNRVKNRKINIFREIHRCIHRCNHRRNPRRILDCNILDFRSLRILDYHTHRIVGLLDSKENKSKSQIIHFPFVSNITIASAKDAAQLRSPTLGCGLDDERGHNGQQDTETQLKMQFGKRRIDQRHAGDQL
jgi:hypothetical protein